MIKEILKGPVWLMQPIPYFGEKLEGEWLLEPKVDGWRLQVIKYQDGEFAAYGRRLEKNPNWTKRLDFLIPASFNLPKGIILDCELYSTGGRRFIPSLFAQKKKAEPVIFVFDIIFYEGEFLGQEKLTKRKEVLKKLNLSPPFYLLESIPLPKETLSVPEKIVEILPSPFAWEGVLLKNANSPYFLGKDGPIATENWRKLKWR
ncbi:MAG: hypothetical protein ABIK99_01130 [candidate division WOR-3 bacterium]